MIYDIRHLTLYEYGSAVTFSHCVLRLLPADGPGQKVLSSELRITPAPAQMIERMCFFGNRLTFLTIETAHRKLIVETNASIEIDRGEPLNISETPAFEIGAPGSLCEHLARQGFARPFPASEPPCAALRTGIRLCAAKASPPGARSSKAPRN